jgi:hypothetical protein
MNEDETYPQPLKRYKKSELCQLSVGFHWEGQYPSVIMDSAGRVVKMSRCVIDCPGNDWFFSVIHRKNQETHVCLLCPLDGPNEFKTQDNKTSNIINKHIKTKHQSQIMPYQHITQDERNRVAKEWKFWEEHCDDAIRRQTSKKAASTPAVRSSLQSTLDQYSPLPVKLQQALWVRGLVLGRSLKVKAIDCLMI